MDTSLQRKVDAVLRSGSKQVIRTWPRRSMITPEKLGLTFHVHNGKLFMPDLHHREHGGAPAR